MKELIGLKKIGEYTDKDYKESDLPPELLTHYVENLNTEDPSRLSAKREAEELLRQELARLKAFKSVYGTTKDFVKAVKYKNTAESLVICVSDWHVGKVIKNEKGVITYDTNIATKVMAEVFADRIIRLIKRIGSHTLIDEVVILLIGDLIENEIIYETQVHHIDMPAVQQKKQAVRALLKFVAAVEEAFTQLGLKNIRIRIEGVGGNHGRTGFRTSEESSWDIAIMDELDLAFTIMKKPNVTVDYSLTPYKNIEIRGHRGLIRHHAPVQAETPSGKAKFGGWHEMFGYNFMCYGHFHHYGIFSYNGIPIFRNGSICGTDSLAVELAVRDRPSQIMFGVSEKEVPTFMYKVNLD